MPSGSDSQPDYDSEKENVHVPQVNQRTGKTKSTLPQFGGKQPKNHPPPPCLNPKCKVEREARKKEIEDLKQKLENLQEELSKKTTTKIAMLFRMKNTFSKVCMSTCKIVLILSSSHIK